MHFDNIISNSSEVEELEKRNEAVWIRYGPNHGGQYVRLNELRVLINRSILSGNTNPRFLNHGNNVLMFGDESYRIQFLKKMGFDDEWISQNLLPEKPLAQVIELFPENEEKKEEPLSVAL